MLDKTPTAPDRLDIRFCTECGTRLLDGACVTGHAQPSRPASSIKRQSRWLGRGIAIAVAAIIVVSSVIGYQRLNGRLSEGSKTAAKLQGQIRSTSIRLATSEQARENLSARVSTLEARAKTNLDVTALASDTLPSVFTIEVRSPLGADLGSAWVARVDGGTSTLITNFHVVEPAWTVGIHQVLVRQGDLTYDGTVVRVSESHDLAAIEVKEQFVPVPVAPAKPSVGDPVVVIGSPYGLEGTVATGVVSAFRAGRMQISAPVSPGDSGGPVLNSQGQVIGVIVSKVAAVGAEALSFSIPAAVVCRTVVSC